MIDTILFIMDTLLVEKTISNFEYFVTYCYFMTQLVHKTIAERVIIDEEKNIRYMSKQNVHQNITGKVIFQIVKYAKDNLPEEFHMFFKNKYKELMHAQEKNKQPI